MSDAGATSAAVAGTAGGQVGPVQDVSVAPEYLDVSVPPGGEFEHPVPRGHSVFAYVFGGRGAFGPTGSADPTPYGDGTLVRFGDGDRIVARPDPSLVAGVRVSPKK